ncbi:T9SS type A sorting domain-containing protein, partial [Bacteroidota bacterium]
LLQNYPNPFNPSTNIVFTLPRESHVKLSVYNLIGEEVAYILDGYRNSGRYEVTFHSSDLTSGIYLLKMVATSAVSGNQFVDIKKMIVLK